jgi:hypothetical protein
MRGRAGWKPNHVTGWFRADSRVPKGRPAAELRRRRGSGRAGSGRSLSGGSSPRPPASFRLWPSSESTSTRRRGAQRPRDLRGHATGDVVRQASDDGRDGGNVLGRLARHGRHGVVLAAPGRQVRPGSVWAELSCPLKPPWSGLSHPDPGSPRRRRARSAVAMRWSQVQPRAWSRLACVSRPAVKIFVLELVHPFRACR